MIKVGVIGGGASGMMAALTAAEDKNNSVILFERQQRLGRKLLSTGNGRCNLTNVNANVENYHGEERDFAKFALKEFSSKDAIAFFESLGLLTVTEYGGRVYPLSNSANSVLDVLRLALQRAGVELRCACPVRRLYWRDGKFTVQTDDGREGLDKVIVCCGGAAGRKLGGVMDGYELLKPLGHRRTELYPALVQLIADSPYPKALKGIRAQAALRLSAGASTLAVSRGELQFTDNGVSGPAAFDVSRAASMGGKGMLLHIDLLPEVGMEKLLIMLRRRRDDYGELEAQELFTGVLHNRLGRMLAKYADIAPSSPLRELDDAALERAAGCCHDFVLPIIGTEGFDNAQVTAGGLLCSQFDPETMQSRYVPGLYCCGELMDIDGDCGGYNLQWAWASGALAGRLRE